MKPFAPGSQARIGARSATLALLLLIGSLVSSSAGAAGEFSGCKTQPRDDQGRESWCCTEDVASSYFTNRPEPRCAEGTLQKLRGQRCPLSQARALPGVRWVCAAARATATPTDSASPAPTASSIPPSAPGPETAPRAGRPRPAWLGSRSAAPTGAGPGSFTSLELDRARATAAPIVDRWLRGERPARASAATSAPPATADLEYYGWRSRAEALEDHGAAALRRIDELLSSPAYRPLFAERVRFAYETSVRTLRRQGRIHYVSLGQFASNAELEANLARLREQLAWAARPDCDPRRLGGSAEEFLGEAMGCRLESLRAFSDETLRSTYSAERFLLATAAVERLGARSEALSPLDLLARWRWRVIAEPRLDEPYRAALETLIPSMGAEPTLAFEVLWGLELTQSLGRDWIALAAFLRARLEDPALRYAVSRGLQSTYAAAVADPSILGDPAKREALLGLGRAILRTQDPYRVQVLAWILSARPVPADPRVLGMLMEIADQTALPLARLQAIKQLNTRLGVRSSPAGQVYDLKAEEQRFFEARLPIRLETARRVFIAGDDFAGVREAIQGRSAPAPGGSGGAARSARWMLRTQVREETRRRLAALDATFDREEEAFRSLLGFGAPAGSFPKLVVMLANDPDDYSILMDIFEGLPSGNGGMYLPRDGVPHFFSFDRTRAQSLYTLEELARHEFVHALQHRYFMPEQPNWNWAALPHWYTEGLAELLVGFQPDGSIAPRETHLRSVAQDERRMSVEGILVSENDADFTEYRYSALFLHYLLTQEPALFRQLAEEIRARRYFYRSAEDNTFTRLGRSLADLDRGYQAHLSGLLAGARLR